VPTELKTFAELGVNPSIVDALSKIGITTAFPIQAMTLPVALAGNDVIGQAKTGTGKTLGFGIPLLQKVSGPGDPGWDQLAQPGAPQALIVAPTRELAVQVAGDLAKAGAQRSVRIATLYGGRAYEPQVAMLRKGVEIVVGTPGRLVDLLQRGDLTLRHVSAVVLDEADEMLDLGFLPDVERLLSLTPAGRQTMLFSATMSGAVVALARRYMTQPTHIRAADPDDTGAVVKAVSQFVYRAHNLDKVEMLARLLQAKGRGLTIVFARTKRMAAKVAEDLSERGFAAAAIHGDLGQGAREQALRAFRNGKVDVLVATDVAARGIDVDDVTHVVNFVCPEDENMYLHRIGRTARAGNKGTAVTFVDWEDLLRWTLVDRTLGLGIPEPVETYSSSPHLYSDLGIPAGTTGTLPRSSRTRAGLDAEEIEDLGETGPGRRRGKQSAPAERSTTGSRAGSRNRRPERTADPITHVAEQEATSAEDRTRRVRRRRRLRDGLPVEGESAAAATAVDVGHEGGELAVVPTDAERSRTREGHVGPDAGSSSTGSTGTRSRSRNRRRSRGGSRTTSAQDGTDAAAQAPVTLEVPRTTHEEATTRSTEESVSGSEPTPLTARDGETGSSSRRRRRRGQVRGHRSAGTQGGAGDENGPAGAEVRVQGDSLAEARELSA